MQRSLIPPPPAHVRHLFCCMDGSCIGTADARRFLATLTELCRDRGLLDYGSPGRVRINESGCLGVCIGGPILVVYPEGIWYALIDEAGMERIVDEHLVGGSVVEEYVLHRLYSAGQEPAPPRADGDVDPLFDAAERSAAEKASEKDAPIEPLPDHVKAARERRRRRHSL